MELTIVRLIAGIRRYGLHRTLSHFGVNVPTAEALLAENGFSFNHRNSEIEWNYMSQPGGRGLNAAIAHVEDVERQVDRALGRRAGNNWPAL